MDQNHSFLFLKKNLMKIFVVENFGNLACITLIVEGWEPILPRAVWITLIVPKGALEEASLRGPNPDWSPCPWG